jgi:hypothetical protein
MDELDRFAGDDSFNQLEEILAKLGDVTSTPSV